MGRGYGGLRGMNLHSILTHTNPAQGHNNCQGRSVFKMNWCHQTLNTLLSFWSNVCLCWSVARILFVFCLFHANRCK